MPFSDPTRRRMLQALTGVALSVGLSGCFQPLYGPTASGAPLGTALAAVEVDDLKVVPIGLERFAHYLRSELIFDLDGSGQPQPKRYRLALLPSQRLQTPIVDTQTGRADSATLIGEVSYTVTALDGGRVITAGKAISSVTYDRVAQRFATIRAARDAEMRLAKLLAEQIKHRVAVAMRAAT